jgi:hypothetical protein
MVLDLTRWLSSSLERVVLFNNSLTLYTSDSLISYNFQMTQRLPMYAESLTQASQLSFEPQRIKWSTESAELTISRGQLKLSLHFGKNNHWTLYLLIHCNIKWGNFMHEQDSTRPRFLFTDPRLLFTYRDETREGKWQNMTLILTFKKFINFIIPF